MQEMRYTELEYFARECSPKALKNLLKSCGGEQTTDGKSCLSAIASGVTDDVLPFRNSIKRRIVARYAANGDKMFKRKNTNRLQLKTIQQLAFNGASERVAQLLTAHADNQATIDAIIKGVNQDRKHFGREETERDRERRQEKNSLIEEFFSKSGRFSDPQSEQQRIATLEHATMNELSEALANKVGAVPSQKL